MFAHSLTREALNELPIGRFNGQIHVAEDEEQAYQLVERMKGAPMLGFDTETRPSFTKGHMNRIALLQLATARHAFLFRLNKMEVPPCVINLLSDPNILKIGVALKNDMNMLFRSATLNPQGFIDLQSMVGKFNIEELGLSKMAGIILGYRISKAQQLSNWEAPKLSEAHLRYAATDAWACYKIYQKLTAADDSQTTL
jgi:ribonuclease D